MLETGVKVGYLIMSRPWEPRDGCHAMIRLGNLLRLRRSNGNGVPPLISRNPPPMPAQEWDLDSPLLYFSDHAGDAWRIRDACEGTQIFGATGSGKTSGSGRALARSFLQNDFGGLVLCAKTDEPELWFRYAEEAGRERAEESIRRMIRAYDAELAKLRVGCQTRPAEKQVIVGLVLIG